MIDIWTNLNFPFLIISFYTEYLINSIWDTLVRSSMLLKLVLPILTFWLLENFKYISAHSHSGQAHLRFRSHLYLGHHDGSSGTKVEECPDSQALRGTVRSVQPGQHTEPLQDSKVNKMSSICYWEKLESVSKVMDGGFPWWGFPCKAKQVSSRPALGQWRVSPPPPADAPRCFLLILSSASVPHPHPI